MRVLVLFPMEKELDAAMGKGWTCRSGSADFEVCSKVCGIGKVNAAIAAADGIRTFMPDVVLNVGCAGALNSLLRVGDRVCSASCAYWDVDCGSPCILGQVQGLPRDFLTPAWLFATLVGLAAPAKFGEILTGDSFGASLEKLHSRFPDALAADMESAAIAHVCHMMGGVPFASVRVISNTPSEKDGEEYAAFWDRAAEHFAFVRGLVDGLRKARW